jgi:predicted Zn-dependent protease
VDKVSGESTVPGIAQKHWVVAMALVVVAGCASSPTGRSQLKLISQQDLAQMGERSFAQLKQEQPVARSPAVNRYVSCVAQALLAQIPGGSSGWEIVVFDDKSVNAFAMPGRKIGVYTGLLKVATNEDQLAAVIGHEIIHVLADHANERISQQVAVGLGVDALSALAGTRGAVAGDATQAVLGTGAQVGILLPFSRLHESEADTVGLDIMAKAGFDPRASVTLWQNMASASKGQPPEFLSTHPSHGSRINELQAHMPQALSLYEAANAAGRRPGCRPPG